jgi:hypothetical protein
VVVIKMEMVIMMGMKMGMVIAAVVKKWIGMGIEVGMV